MSCINLWGNIEMLNHGFINLPCSCTHKPSGRQTVCFKTPANAAPCGRWALGSATRASAALHGPRFDLPVFGKSREPVGSAGPGVGSSSRLVCAIALLPRGFRYCWAGGRICISVSTELMFAPSAQRPCKETPWSYPFFIFFFVVFF